MDGTSNGQENRQARRETAQADPPQVDSPLVGAGEGSLGKGRSLHAIALELTWRLRDASEDERQEILELYRSIFQMLSGLERDEAERGQGERRPAGFTADRDS